MVEVSRSVCAGGRPMPVVGLCRSGVEPPTGTIHPRQISPAILNSENHPPEMNRLIGFPLSVCYSPAFAWVDHSGRGFNPRPTQGWNDPPPLNVFPQFQIRQAIPPK